MAKSGQSRAQANRAIRREALLDQLKAAGLIPQINENIKKLQDLDAPLEDWQRLKAATDLQFKLLAKVMPDLKATELTGDVGLGVTIIERRIVEASD